MMNKIARRAGTRFSAIATGLLMAFSALAEAPSDTPTGAISVAESPAALDKIVVTAQKRSESAQSVPITVSTLSGATLQQYEVKDLFQAVTLVPGVIFSRAPDDGLGLTFRGLGAAARPEAFEQSVALFTDGVFMGKGRLYTTSFFDVDRMEFIHGTQSTLLGKNASVGAISVVTRQPGSTFSADTTVGYEFINHGYMVDSAVDLPFGNGFSTRLAVHYNDLNGSIDNTATGNNVPIDKDLGLRLSALWTPIELLKVTASYQYADNERIGTGMQLIGALPPGFGEGVLNHQETEYTDRTRNGDAIHNMYSSIASLKADLQLGYSDLIAQTAYVHYRLNFDDDFDFNIDPYIDFQRYEEYHQFTQELRFQSDTSKALQYMVGAFYLNNHWDSTENQLWDVPAFPPPPSPISGQLYNGPFSNHFIQDANTESAFASGKYALTSEWAVSGGVRYTREDKQVLFGRTPFAPFTIWNSIANPPFAPTPLAHDSAFWDGNVSVDYQVTTTAMLYAAFAHGSKSGGYVETNSIAVPPPMLVNGKVPAALVAAGAAIADEFTKSYEIGVKSEWLERRLRLNLAIFKIDVKNFQDSVFTGGPLGFLTTNSPANSKGVEVETAFRLTSHLRFDGAVTYADATQVVRPVINGVLLVNGSGAPVYQSFTRPQAPKITATVGADYGWSFANSLAAHVGLHALHRSAMFNERQEEFPSNELTTLDISTGIATAEGRWKFDVIAKNITNAIAADFGGPSVDPRFRELESPNPGRSVMLTVSEHF